MRVKHYRRVQVILKVVERCNLACSYCYYFEGGDQSYKEKPPVISMKTVESLADFLSRGIDDLLLDEIWISFHGGEPMMLKPAVFDEICGVFRQKLACKAKLILSVQTNGTHVTPKWLELFEKYDVNVSVSIDGLKEAHDRYRKDHHDRGSFDRVSQNFKVLDKASRDHGGLPTEIITVLDAKNNYREIMRGLIDQLGVRNFNFLLPDCNHDDGIPNGLSPEDYGRALCDIFDMWAESEDIVVREVDLLLSRFQLAVESDGPSKYRSTNDSKFRENQVIVVRSDGELQIDDTFIPASDWRNKLTRININAITLKSYLSLPVFDEIDSIYHEPPDLCTHCVWRSICNGGDLENRYSASRGFNNPSVYCTGLKMFYRHCVLFLRRNGYPSEVLRDRLRPVAGRHKYSYAK